MAVQLNITAVQVSWSAPASGATVTGYDINYETTGGSEQSVTVGTAATEHTLTGLTIGQTYTISIVALSAQLPSILTNSVEVTVGQTIRLYAIVYNECSLHMNSGPPEYSNQLDIFLPVSHIHHPLLGAASWGCC